MIRVELYKQLRRVRTWVSFGVLVALPTIVALANRFGHPERHRDGAPALYFFATRSGLNHALAALAFMSPFFLVVIVSAFGGESVAGEAGWGTLRSLLVRPVSRPRLLANKIGVVAMLSLGATLVIVVAGLASGTAAFGWHDLSFSTRSVFEPTPALEAVGRLGLASLYVWWTVAAIAAFAFFLSTVMDSSAGAIGAAFGLSVVSQIFDGISSLRFLQPGLPTHYWSAWSSLFVPLGRNRDMVHGVIVAAIWITIFLALAFRNFARKDILS